MRTLQLFENSFHSNDIDLAEGGYRNYDDNRTGFSKNSQAYRADGGANDENHEIDRQREQQEKSGTWYIRLNGKLIKDKQGNPYAFRGKAAANKAALTMQAKLFNKDKEFILTTNPNDKPQGVAEEHEGSPVASAITRRILLQRSDLLSKYGPVSVTAAIDDVADYVGDVEEIGSSDVSGWIRQVEQMLADNPPEAFGKGVAEAAKWRTHTDAHDLDTDGSYIPKGGIKSDNLAIRQKASKTQSEKDPKSMAGMFGAKYAKKHGVPTKQLMKNIPLDDKEQGVAEGSGDKKPYPNTWHDVDPKLGKQVDKMSPEEKVEKGYANPSILKKNKQQGVAEGGENRSRLIHFNTWTVMDGDEEVMRHSVERDPFFSAKKFIRQLDDEGYDFTHVVSPEGRVTYLPHLDPRHFPKDEVDEDAGPGIMVNGKEVDMTSLEVDGVDPRDYPDFSDAYFSAGYFVDGTEMSDQELDQFQNDNGDLLYDRAYDSLHESEISQSRISKMNKPNQEFYGKNPHFNRGLEVKSLGKTVDAGGNPVSALATKVTPQFNKPAPVKKLRATPFEEGAGDLQQRLSTLESAMVKARNITKAIKYDGTVSDILVSIRQLAENAGIDARDLTYAEDEVFDAKKQLESAIYGLDEIFEDAIQNLQYQIQDAEEN